MIPNMKSLFCGRPLFMRYENNALVYHIPYFMAYLIYYFHNEKARGNSKKVNFILGISVENTQIKHIKNDFLSALLNSSITKFAYIKQSHNCANYFQIFGL